jgi:hypothetical protein
MGEFGRHSQKTYRAYGTRNFIHTAAVVMFWVIASPYAEGSFDLKYAFSFVPLGFVAIAIPIAPSGLGVGHVIFDKLFSFFNVMNGASLFNIYIFTQIFFNIIGLVPYLLNKKEIKEEEVLRIKDLFSIGLFPSWSFLHTRSIKTFSFSDCF